MIKFLKACHGSNALLTQLINQWLFRDPAQSLLENIVHSMRLFPVGHGADGYSLTGIASLCDWVILSDAKDPKIRVCKRRPTEAPLHVFLSLRNPQEALCFFVNTILPSLSHPFVLISGSEDVTLPRQTDQRWPPFETKVTQAIEKIEKSHLLLHWFVENLDDRWSEKVSPMPTGRVFPARRSNARLIAHKSTGVGQRPLRALCAHRMREGPQWEAREKVVDLARNDWQDFVDVLDHPVPEEKYVELLKAYPFVLCVEGGGVDPSPKAWHAIQCGALPVIRKTATWDAYRKLPCVGVDFWRGDQLNVRLMKEWRDELGPFLETVELRKGSLKRLSLGYWWRKVEEKARNNGTADPC